MLKLYNTFTKSLETLESNGSYIKIYLCGPTVQSSPHIGHGRSAVVFDFMVRYIKFSGNKDKTYNGIVDSLASKIDVSNRSLRLRVKMQNSNSEILPGALMEVTIKYNERVSLGIPDTSVILEGNKVYIYKVDNENVTKRVEVTVGNRNKGYLEVESGLNEGDIVVAEGLKKVRPNGKIKPIKDGEKKSKSSWGKKENKSK